jgi:hypothetical protein
MHATLNPFIAYLLISKNYPAPYFIEVFFLVFRGFVGPVKDILQLSLICLMIRENIYHSQLTRVTTNILHKKVTLNHINEESTYSLEQEKSSEMQERIETGNDFPTYAE